MVNRSNARKNARKNSRRRNVIVYSGDGKRASFASVKDDCSNEAHLRFRNKTNRSLSSAAKMFNEEGSSVYETNESRVEAIVRLEREGYSFIGKKSPVRVPFVDSGAWIYSIEKGDESYIGWTRMDVWTRLNSHACQRSCTAARLIDGCDRVRVLEHYCPGEWTTSGMERREHEVINQTPGCVNYKNNEAVLKD